MAVVIVVACLVVGAAASQGPLAGVGAIALVATGLAFLRSPAAAAYTLVGVVPVISGLERGLPVPGLRLSEVLIVALAGLILVTVRRRQASRWRTFDWIALAYVIATPVFGLLGTALRGASLAFDDFGLLAGPLQFLLIYHAVRIALPTAAHRRRAVDVVLSASLLVSSIALLQAFNFPGVRAGLAAVTGVDFSDRLSWTFLRASGPFDHWTMLSGYLLVIVLLCAAVLLHRRDQTARRLALLAIGPAAAALVVTVTIAPMIGAIIGVMLLAAWSQQLMRTASIAAVAAVVLGLAFSPLLAERAQDQFGARAPSGGNGSVLPTTLSNRLEIWTEQYVPVVERHLLTGYGPQIPSSITWPYSESVYLTMLLRGGLPLLAIFVGLMVFGARLAREGRDAADRNDRALSRMMYALILMIVVIQTIVPYFVATGLPHLWWALMALVSGAAAQAREDGRRPFAYPPRRAATVGSPPSGRVLSPAKAGSATSGQAA